MKFTLKRWVAFVLALVMFCLSGCVQQNPVTTEPATDPTGDPTIPIGNYPEIPDGCKQLVIHWNYTGDITKAAFWAWSDSASGQGYPVEEDDFGCVAIINVPESTQQVGFIACYNCSTTSGTSWIGGTKDVDSDRYVDMDAERVVIYLKRGDANIYYRNDGGTLQTMKEFKMAELIDFDIIRYTITPATMLTSKDQIKIYDGDREIGVKAVTNLNEEADSAELRVTEALDLSKTYEIEIEGYGRKSIIPTEVFDTYDFVHDYTYDGDDLGAVIHGDNTTFKVWAPTASKVVLNLFTSGHEGTAYKTVEMQKGERGVWSYTEACGHGTYYTYTVTTAVGTNEATDPYAKSAGCNGNRSMVIDLSLTDPQNWSDSYTLGTTCYTDAVIWEVHVRDFSNKIASSQYKGKYLAFTERGLTNSAGAAVGMDYLINLGITHVHLLPVYDYATVDEANPDSSFNWGYDPKNYNVPEGSYSTNPYDGTVRVNEYKQMVQALHDAGIGVIMDVVYNHTYSSDSSFNRIVPYYYYRYDSKGENSNASGCGNDTASERYMYRKFMVDSVTYWASEYNLDGFRFDLMGLHDLETMQQIEEAVHAINPDAIIYGEGWTMGSTTDGSAQANQTNIDKVKPTNGATGSISVFNDAIRDGLKGSVFEATSKGYISGAYAANEEKVQFGISGGETSAAGWTVSNGMVINYMSAHDNNTLWDKLLLSNPNNTVEERLAMNRLGAAILMISKGTPFWQAGEEMLRTKNGDENSYNSSDAINNIDWEALVPGSDTHNMMLYYKGLIAMRSAYDVFTAQSGVQITFGRLSGGGMVVNYTTENGKEAVVLINPTGNATDYALEDTWKVVANGTQAGAEVIETVTGTVSVEACSILVMVR